MLTLETWSPTREMDRMERQIRRLYDTEKEFVLELEVPGFDEKELAVEITDHALTITGEHEQEVEKTQQALVLHERLQRRFTRRFELPAETDTEHISAACEKGLLTLHVPKAETAPVRKVEITKA